MSKIKEIKEFLKRLVWIIGKNSIPTFFILFFLALILGGFIFYKYSFLAERIEPQIIKKPLQFKEALCQKILEEWQTRQQRFEETELKEYSNLFRPPVLTPEELTE
ncbi:hypothetical protein KJA16_02980 [Patescibacteria group bacterium]|nr:hypothetical protein [Patescibacteria group bacterium]